MEETPQEKRIDIWFRLSVLAKGAISFVETLAGILVVLIPPQHVIGFIRTMSENALADDPDDFLATHSMHVLAHLPPISQGFIALYLISRGLIKLILVIALLKNQLWAYPASLAVLGLFILYQVHEILKSHSVIVALVTLFDLVVVWFIWREWQIVKAHPRHKAEPVHAGE